MTVSQCKSNEGALRFFTTENNNSPSSSVSVYVPQQKSSVWDHLSAVMEIK